LRVDWIGFPGWNTESDRVHTLQQERFEVLSGRLGLRVDGVERVLEEAEVGGRHGGEEIQTGWSYEDRQDRKSGH
jgi:uncharacterized cupin superfamily protein